MIDHGSYSPLPLLRSVCSGVRRTQSNGAEYSEEWLALSMLCPEALQAAIDVLDHKSIARITARKSGRFYHLVDGQSRDRPHLCLPGFCSCMSYCISVATKPDSLVCKHEVAVLLSDSLGQTLQREVDDEQWASDFFARTCL